MSTPDFPGWTEADGAYFAPEADANILAPCPECAAPMDMEADSLGEVVCSADSHRYALRTEAGVAMLHSTAAIQPIDSPVVYSDDGVLCPACDSTVPVLHEFYDDIYYTCPHCGTEMSVYMTPEGADVNLADEDPYYI